MNDTRYFILKDVRMTRVFHIRSSYAEMASMHDLKQPICLSSLTLVF